MVCRWRTEPRDKCVCALEVPHACVHRSGKFLQLLGWQLRGNAGRIGLQYRRSGGHSDRFSGGGNLKLRIEADLDVCLNDDTLRYCIFKGLGMDG